MRRFDVRYAAWVVGLASLTLLPLFAGFAGIAWELGQIAGLAAALLCVLLCGAPLRPRNARPSPAVSLGAHTWLGWIALAAVAAHVGCLLLAEPTAIEYLKLTAPLHMGAGVLAALLMLVVVSSSAARARRRLFGSHRGFQAAHVVLGAVLLAMSAVHVIGTERYLGGVVRRMLWIGVSIGALLLVLRYRRPGPVPPATRAPRLVFGRHSAWVFGGLAVIVVALAGLSWGAADSAVRRPLIARTAALPLDFPHAKHVTINCLECHHNYTQGDFSNTCVACHRSARPDLKMPAEPRFHAYCLDCHRHPDGIRIPDATRHGPVAGCGICHRAPTTEDTRAGP